MGILDFGFWILDFGDWVCSEECASSIQAAQAAYYEPIKVCL
jgi:hypothetical protein